MSAIFAQKNKGKGRGGVRGGEGRKGGGRTNERPGTDHVISGPMREGGPMRGLELIM